MRTIQVNGPKPSHMEKEVMYDATLKPLVRKLALRRPLSESDQQSILSLQFRLAERRAHVSLSSELPGRDRFCILASGFAYLQRLAPSGTRHIQAIFVPGDLIDLNVISADGQCRLEAAVPSVAAFIDRQTFAELASTSQNIRGAIWAEMFAQNAICREWLYNVSRRSAFERLCHFLCELAQRQTDAGVSDGTAVPLPMTQADLGDATGLTPVHVNRTLRRMRETELINYERRLLTIQDVDRLKSTCSFDSRYLYPEAA